MSKPRKANKDHHEKVWTEDKVITDPQSYDIVIPIMGITGSGKSTVLYVALSVALYSCLCQLINTLLDNASLTVGHDIDPCTQTVQFVVVAHPKAPTHRIVLLDTPGLDSITSPDEEILKRIASWLSRSYGDGMKLAGIVFLYEINQTRDLSSARKNLDRFENLCGDAATQNVILATTKWTSPPNDQDVQRESELQGPRHWGQLIRRGSRMCRLDDISYDAAWKLINLSLADAFTFDTEKIKDDVERIRESLKKKSDGQRLMSTLEELLISQNDMALEMKRGGGLTDVLWNQLVENDRRIRDTVRQINVKVPLSQKVKSFFKLFVSTFNAFALPH
ncbi:hypothetical protein DXG01_002906 [Tephrocybe rancida]|nr:hypothetical protein DXG01_002906 [Tephrocybe rancida]